MTSITFKLSPMLREKLEKAAAKDGRTISDFIRNHFAKKLPATTPTARKAKGGKR